MNLTFAFESLPEFFAMGGHGGYVWTAWSIGLLVIILLVGQSLYARNQLKKRLYWQQQQRILSDNLVSKASMNTKTTD